MQKIYSSKPEAFQTNPVSSMGKRLSFIFIAVFAMSLSTLFSQVTYTFTTAGATGQYGPTQSQVTTAYAATNLSSAVTVTLQGVQQWTVPVTGLYRINCKGAQGGSGLGANIVGDCSLTVNQVVSIVVGQQGVLGGGGSGGGGSFVVKKTSTTPVVADILVIAGGGGGTGGGMSGNTSGASELQPGVSGGSGGNNQGCIGGGGGFLTDGNINAAGNDNGAHGVSFINGCNGGSGVSGVIGGYGGGAGMTCGPAGWNAGGGGYTGGGGGGTAGGGGGSYNAGTNQTNTAGSNSGNGVIVITQLFTLDVAQTASIMCHGLSTAAFSSTANGAPGPYTYTWLPSGGNASTASGLAAGVYTVTARSSNSILAVNVFTITEPTALATSITSQTNVTCNGGANGAASINVSGGTIPYSYTWTPSVSGTTLATGMTAGSYSLLIKDVNNCAITQPVTITQPSTFTVSGSASSPTLCNGGTTSLNGSGATTYTWSQGVTNGATFTPTATTSYSLTGTNSAGCLSTGTIVVTVTVYSLPVISVNNGTICTGQIFTMTPSGASTYSYSSISNTVSPTSNNSYSVTGTSSAGCVSPNAAISSVTVYTLPVIAVNSGTICSGNSFTMTPSGANTYSYTGGNAVVSPLSNSSYSVTGTSTAGCISASAAVSQVTVIALPVVTVNSGSICAGQSFTMVPSGAVTYTFANGNAVVTPSASNVYSVTGTSSVGCISLNALSSVTVNAVPVISVTSGSICNGHTFTMVPSGASTYTFSNGSNTIAPSVSTSYSVSGTSIEGCLSASVAISGVTVYALPVITANSGSICSGQSFTITGGGANTYTYSGGAIVSPTITQSYSVTGTSVAGCLSASAAISSVTVFTLPVVTANSSNTVICAGESASLTAGGALTYSWSTGATSTVIAITPSATALYTVTGHDINGCANTAIATQSVSDCTGISTLKGNNKSDLKIYPNPNSGEFSINTDTDLTVSIFNEVGEVVMNIQLNETNNHKINISNFANGIYFVVGKNQNQVISQKIIVNK